MNHPGVPVKGLTMNKDIKLLYQRVESKDRRKMYRNEDHNNKPTQVLLKGPIPSVLVFLFTM